MPSDAAEKSTAARAPGSAALLRARLHAQLLTGPPAASPVEVAERLLAVQGQDPRGARLAVRARTSGLRASDVDSALNERALLIATLNRGTLHLVRSEDFWLLHPLTTPALRAGNARRLEQEGVSPAAAERGVEVAERALAADGPQTRGQLRERIAAAGVRVEGQALVHILMLAALRGLVVRGPMLGNDHAFALVRDWLGPAPPVPDRDVALAELARRYLLGHGPASDRDLAKWAGLPLRDARRGLRAVEGLVEYPAGLVNLAHRPTSNAAPPPPRLLGSFDPVLLGWTSREQIVGAHQTIVTVNGLFRPFALVDGRAVAIWSMPAGRVVLVPFAPLGPADQVALDLDAIDVQRFLGN